MQISDEMDEFEHGYVQADRHDIEVILRRRDGSDLIITGFITLEAAKAALAEALGGGGKRMP